MDPILRIATPADIKCMNYLFEYDSSDNIQYDRLLISLRLLFNAKCKCQC